MRIDVPSVRKLLEAFDFKTLFREQLGWDNHQAQLSVPVDGNTVELNAVAQKRGFVAYICPTIPDRATRLKIDRQVTKSAHEHFIIYTDQRAGQQVWQWVRRELGKPLASRDHRFDATQSGDPLIQRLEQIAVAMDEEERITVVDVASRARTAFDVEKVTKRFYDRFKDEHAAFMKFIAGIKTEADLQWYTSLMLNRLMFVYFIQKKGFLDSDFDYLRNRLAMVRKAQGKDKFQSFYRYFLLRLFHDGLGKAAAERGLDPAMEKLLGRVPFLNGGFFEVHELEERSPDIDIPDEAFEKLFDFFDQYSWHLDERPLRDDNEINPDVVGYIFEKYINQKQMGAYYTKEDITEYISKNTIIPFLFDAAEKKCAIAFKPDGALWRLLRDDPDRYIYAAVRHGVVHAGGEVAPESELPDFVRAGMRDPNARLFDKRYNLSQSPADDAVRLVTETWREYAARRARCLEIRERLRRGDVHQINDLITLNLDIWQFARDAIINCEGPELLRAFWHAIEKLTVLDPTCGSGAFLFAALRILETLYSDCLERMERFVEDMAGRKHHPEQFSDFKKVLAQIAQHPNDRYFILKSIIINNLFGVDIMEEAVEICKLRLFLKLVAQVETADQIEPLPDIDFNIRAGNTLVGYTSLDQVRKSQEGRLGFSDAIIKRIEEDAEIVERAFQQFRAQQTIHGGKVTHKDKQQLRRRLEKLDDELDRYLTGEYGVKIEKQKDFEAWKASHQPFHWFVEFYGIMTAGGFDVIIGNPPWVEYAKIRSAYGVLGYRTAECNNLWAFVVERSLVLLNKMARCGLIVPMSLVCTDRMVPAQKLLGASGSSWLSNYESDSNPGQLFTGVKQNVSIAIHAVGAADRLFTTRLFRFFSEARDWVFPQVEYTGVRRKCLGFGFPKIGRIQESELLDRLFQHAPLSQQMTATGSSSILVHRIAHYYIKCFDFVPYFRSDRDGEKKSEDYKEYTFKGTREPFVALINSSLFYFYWQVLFDGFKAGKACVEGFPCDVFSNAVQSNLKAACGNLMKNLKANAVRLCAKYAATGAVEYDQFRPRLSKAIMDTIDVALSPHYEFTPEQLDFVINYDIKYRLGAGNEGEEGE